MNLKLRPGFSTSIRCCLSLVAVWTALSVGAFQLVPSVGTNGLFHVQFPTTVGFGYTLYRGADIAYIHTLVDVAEGTGGVFEIADTNPPTASQMFYRVSEAPLFHLVINEVDYDQFNTDAASFIEIYNPSGIPVPLTNLAVVLINGAGNTEYARFNLSLAGSALPAGGYLVIKNDSVTVPPGALTIEVSGDFIQNGAPDGVALIDTAAQSVIDALSYEGSIASAPIIGFDNPVNLVEGTATVVADSNSVSGSLGRLPNGSDTDNASDDWSFISPSPGTANL